MRYGRSPSGDFVLMADDIGAEVITTLSPNAAAALRDALTLYFAEQHGQVVSDEPTLLTGDAD